MVVNRIDCEGWYFMPLALVKSMLKSGHLSIDNEKLTKTVQGRILQHHFEGDVPQLLFTKGRDSSGKLKTVRWINPKSPIQLVNVGKDKSILWYIPLEMTEKFGADVLNDCESLIRMTLKPLKPNLMLFPYDMGVRILNPENYLHVNDLKDMDIVEITVPLEN